MKTCVSCSHSIDETARVCPFCGANPESGDRIDTESLLRQEFGSAETTASENVIEYARQRQGVVIAISVIVGFLALAGLHQFVTIRNARAVSDAPAIPLSEIADVTRSADEMAPVDLPDLDFFHDGQPRAMRTFIVESGAVVPPQPAAAAGAVPGQQSRQTSPSPAPTRPAPRPR